MSPNPPQPKKRPVLRLRVLQAANLQEDHSVQPAIDELETAVIICGGEAVLAAALEEPNALPYVVSSESFVSKKG